MRGRAPAQLRGDIAWGYQVIYTNNNTSCSFIDILEIFIAQKSECSLLKTLIKGMIRLPEYR